MMMIYQFFSSWLKFCNSNYFPNTLTEYIKKLALRPIELKMYCRFIILSNEFEIERHKFFVIFNKIYTNSSSHWNYGLLSHFWWKHKKKSVYVLYLSLYTYFSSYKKLKQTNKRIGNNNNKTVMTTECSAIKADIIFDEIGLFILNSFCLNCLDRHNANANANAMTSKVKRKLKSPILKIIVVNNDGHFDSTHKHTHTQWMNSKMNNFFMIFMLTMDFRHDYFLFRAMNRSSIKHRIKYILPLLHGYANVGLLTWTFYC